jgi:hypothetical protein
MDKNNLKKYKNKKNNRTILEKKTCKVQKQKTKKI